MSRNILILRKKADGDYEPRLGFNENQKDSSMEKSPPPYVRISNNALIEARDSSVEGLEGPVARFELETIYATLLLSLTEKKKTKKQKKERFSSSRLILPSFSSISQ